MIDKILSHLGIYDILGVFLSGICMNATFIFLKDYLCINHYIFLICKNAFLLIISSYILGLIFQELTSFICKNLIFCDNKLLKKALKVKENSNIYMEESELKAVNEFVKSKTGSPSSDSIKDNIVYNYCKNYMLQKGKNADRDQALASMARNLSFFCLLLSLLLIQSIFVKSGNIHIYNILILVTAFLAFLFFERFVRFSCRRYVSIYRFLLYNEIWPCTEKQQ